MVLAVEWGSGSAADQLTKLAELHSNGSISDDGYAAAKAKVVSGRAGS